MENANGTDMQTWIWKVTEAGAAPTADSSGVEDASGRSGTYVEVPVNIRNVMNGPVLGIGFEIAYNKSVINVTNVSKGNLTSNWSKPNVNNNFTWGTKITIAGSYAADAISNGTTGSVVLLNFSVIGSPGDTSPMNMTLIEFSNPDGEVGTAPARNGTFTVTTTPTPASLTGGSGGGGGYVPTTPTPTEKPPAVEKAVKTISSIEAGKPESVTFDGLNVHKISIEVDKNVSDVNVMIEKVEKPEEITDALGIVYAYYNITATNLTDVNVTATIEFKVNKSWMTNENVDEATIKLYRYDEGWKVLSTSKINEDDAYVYFSADTHVFSIFAISGEEKVGVAATPSPTLAPGITPSATSTQTPAPAIPPAQVPVISWSIILVAISISVIIVIIGYLLMKKKS